MTELSIGEAARETGLSVKTIRYYERIGLIPKARRHDAGAHTGGNRVFDEADIGRLKFIRHARMLELSLDEIRTLLEPVASGRCPGGEAEYQRILQAHLQDIDVRVAHLLGLRRQIQSLLAERVGTDPGPCDMTTCGCMEVAAAESESAAPAERPGAGCACCQ